MEVVIVRHGETEWSRSGQHTGRTDVPLTDAGRESAAALRDRFGRRSFERVLTSPLARASETCRLAGYGDDAELRNELLEWDYGDYEGRTTVDIRAERPGWTVWSDGCPGGEAATDVGHRVDQIIAELAAPDGDAILFAHGHVLRILAARWLELAPEAGGRFTLGTAAVSVLGHERETAAMLVWNHTGHLDLSRPGGGH